MFYVKSPERVKRVAKDLTRELAVKGYTSYPYNRCLDLVAKMYGFSCYAELQDKAGQHPPSKDDALVDGEIAKTRRGHHIAVLVEAGVTTDASAIVDAVKPTDRADPRKRPFAIVQWGLDLNASARALDWALRRMHLQRRLGSMKPNMAAISALYDDDLVELWIEPLLDAAVSYVDELLSLHDAGVTLKQLRHHVMIHAAPEPSLALSKEERKAWRSIWKFREKFEPEPDIKDGTDEQEDMLYELTTSHFIDPLHGEPQAYRLFCERCRECENLGGTIADLASSIAETDLLYRSASDNEMLYSLPFETLRTKDHKWRRLHPAAAEKVIRRAFTNFVLYGGPIRLFEFVRNLDNPWVDRHETITITRPRGGEVSIAEALAIAHRAGLTLSDLKRASVAASNLCVGAPESTVSQDDMTRLATMDGVGADAELTTIAMAMGLSLWTPNSASDYFDLLEELSALELHGVSLADLACALLTDGIGQRAALILEWDAEHAEFMASMSKSLSTFTGSVEQRPTDS